MKFLRFDFNKIRKEVKKKYIEFNVNLEFTAYAALRVSEFPHLHVFLLVVYI